MRRRVVALLAATLVFGACSYGELLEFVESSAGSGGLTSPDQPLDVQASGSTEEAEKTDEDAKEEITKALDPEVGVGTKIGHAQKAVEARPNDPRYVIYRSWFNLIAGDDEAAKADLGIAYGLTQQNIPASDAERRFAEYYLDATAAIMLTYPEGSETRDRMEFVYCLAMFRYRADFGESLPGAAYLDFTANTELCT